MRSIIPAVYHYCFEVFVKSEPYSLTNTYFPGVLNRGKSVARFRIKIMT